MDGGRHSSFTPPLPPTSEDSRLAWIRLLRSPRIGIATFYRLIAEHGSAQAALEALPQIAAERAVSRYSATPLDAARREWRAAAQAQMQVLFAGAPDYPATLYDLTDPPPILFALGRLDLLHRPQIALIGARNASSLGLRMARRLAQDLGAAGHVITSGLARGVDASAQEAALTTGTIAVLGGGADVVYPRENAALYDQIRDSGLILSEQPPGLKPAARHFPPRNRLIAALSRAVVVVEAAVKSGSLITARDALDLGRDVLAVPGHPLDPRAGGPNLLLRDGAVLVRHGQDILQELGPAARTHGPVPGSAVPDDAAPDAPVPQTPPHSAPLSDMPVPDRLLALLADTAQTEDMLAEDSGLPLPDVLSALCAMELRGQATRCDAGRWRALR